MKVYFVTDTESKQTKECNDPMDVCVEVIANNCRYNADGLFEYDLNAEKICIQGIEYNPTDILKAFGKSEYEKHKQIWLRKNVAEDVEFIKKLLQGDSGFHVYGKHEIYVTDSDSDEYKLLRSGYGLK